MDHVTGHQPTEEIAFAGNDSRARILAKARIRQRQPKQQEVYKAARALEPAVLAQNGHQRFDPASIGDGRAERDAEDVGADL